MKVGSYISTSIFMQVNPKAAESLADPEEYPNLFDDWQVALSVESKVAGTRYWKTIFLFIYA